MTATQTKPTLRYASWYIKPGYVETYHLAVKKGQSIVTACGIKTTATAKDNGIPALWVTDERKATATGQTMCPKCYSNRRSFSKVYLDGEPIKCEKPNDESQAETDDQARRHTGDYLDASERDEAPRILQPTAKLKKRVPELKTRKEELVGEFDRERWRLTDETTGEPKTKFIAHLRDGTCIHGHSEPGELQPNFRYRFSGVWKESERFGRQFHFDFFQLQDPHTREGIATYLAKFAPGIGRAIAHKIIDEFGREFAISQLKRSPRDVANRVSGLTPEKAELAAEALRSMEAFEETKIELLELFDGRGFPSQLMVDVIKAWGVSAPQRIRRDPWCLIVNRMPGCGFKRIDSLYLDLGLPPDKLRRQVFCLWYLLRSDMSGHTWRRRDELVGELLRMVTGQPDPDKAIYAAGKVGILAERESGGVKWLAHGAAARAEETILERLEVLA